MSAERIARLEAERESDHATIQDMSADLKQVRSDVAEIKLGIANQKGFLAGVLAVLLPIWTFITLAVGAAWDWWQSGGTHQ